MSFADWLWSVVALALRLKTTPDVLDTNSTHTGITQAHFVAPHTCDCIDNVRYVGHTVRYSRNHQWLLGLEHIKFSLHEKWNKCQHPYRICKRLTKEHERQPGNKPLGLIVGFHGQDIHCIIHSLIQELLENWQKDEDTKSRVCVW